MAGKRGRPRKHQVARCPEPGHAGNHVTAQRDRKSGTSTRRVFRCRSADGTQHYFTVIVSEHGPVPAPVDQPPPPCPQGHLGGKVTRDGTYGTRTALRRQRYRCWPDPVDEPDVSHSFVPPLARHHIHADGEQCAACEELRGVHRGDPAVARGHTWPAKIVAEALKRLAEGGSYAEVSRWALRQEARQLERAEKARQKSAQARQDSGPQEEAEVVAAVADAKPSAPADKPAAGSGSKDAKRRKRDSDKADASADDAAAPAGEGMGERAPRNRRPNTAEARVVVISGGKERRLSRASVEAKNVWHIAADWCEVFGPVVWAGVDERLRERGLAERARLDALRAEGKPLERPQVLVIDDMPTYGRDTEGTNRRRRDKGFFLLTIAEVVWTEPDPFDSLALPVARTQLRLVRAFPKANTPAWRLAFDELGYAPDFIVSDAGTGQLAAIRAHYPGTVFVPSTWHVGQAVRTALKDVPAAHETTLAGKALVPDLEAHLRLLTRGKPPLASVEGLTEWWDELLAWAKRNKAPVEKLRKRRDTYEPALAAALPMLVAHPEVPISTGGLETLQRRVLEPVLAGRRAVFANIERTNTLLDLAIAGHHGALDDANDVMHLLRTDALDAQGHSAPLRMVADPQGAGPRYSSLRDATLLSHLARERGLA